MRVLWLFVAFLLAASPAARADDLQGDAARGATDFTKACTRCHKTPDQVAAKVDITKPETVYAMDDFLATHHTTDAVMRADIVAYLLTL
jgi:cytochrome c553